MQADRQAAGLSDDLLVERNFPKDFQAILKAEYAKRRKIEQEQTAEEFKETAEAAATAHHATPDEDPRDPVSHAPVFYRMFTEGEGSDIKRRV